MSDRRVVLRVTVSIWARPEIAVELLSGCRPTGPLEEDADAAIRALTPLAEQELARGRGLQALRERLTGEPWDVLRGLQGDDVGPTLPERRSVVRDCGACAGAGGFACTECSGVGRRLCTSCAGSGQVDQECPTCKSAASPPERSTVALDPKRALQLLVGQAATGAEAGAQMRAAIERSPSRGCPDCGGAQARRTDCAQCAGAGERRCQACGGTGRTPCASCDATGSLTDNFSGRIRFERSLHLSLASADAEAEAPVGAADAIRASWDALVAARAFEPRMIGFQSSGFAAQAVFEAELSLSRLRAHIGARAPRVKIDFWAAGAPAVLLDPPKALDALHRRAVDAARLSTREGRRQVADALTDLACGRAALRAAARRERDLPSGAFGPLASDEENARLLALAKDAHGAVGWRAERRVWTAAAVLAAPLGWLAAQGLSPRGSPSAPAPIAASADAAALAPGAAEAGATWIDVSWLEASWLEASWVGFVAATPFLLLWMLAGLAAAAAYRRATRRALGFTRARSAWRVYLGGWTPLTALAAAFCLYAVGLVGGGRQGPASPAAPIGPVQAAAVAAVGNVVEPAAATLPREPDAAQPLVVASLGPVEETPPPVDAAEAARAAEAEVEPPRLEPVADGWRARDARAAVLSRDGAAVLTASCGGGRAWFRLEAPYADLWSRGARPTVVWRTERTGLAARGLTLEGDAQTGLAPSWYASAAAVRALKRDGRLTVEWSGGRRSGRHVFTLRGATKALGGALPGC